MNCRHFLVDCYDGPDGQPRVYHGFTFIKSCPFETIIRAIQPHLFTVSPYPVVLDIENHCTPDQQKEMARILKEILGDKPLQTDTPFILPSPDDLKYKVLIRSPKVVQTTPVTKTLPPQDEQNELFISASERVDYEFSQLLIYLQNVPYRDYAYAKRNCLNPIWDETMIFNISVPELCLVRFVVLDSDVVGSDDILSSFCLPLTTMQIGYRHIHLRKTDDDPTYSTLFVHVNIQNYNDSTKL
ncbi:unnamed protein product [Didymodactylos carnosus]|uniref:C2 domain-containing protein n=1 Tax=Didymodactylos carnosus TaxID=1234261 RepID=A0A814TF52_9BILA|nr:unnamed protein product [Didymodactylos carnosus]CAF1160624.1 unnamed protein product [Didymodactylos carnosus]CAF3841320.1 unnamed protein product [Didymodactylos carnosus]CAF3924166.1 unnamed protein product [Didymodactylos carnosus]